MNIILEEIMSAVAGIVVLGIFVVIALMLVNMGVITLPTFSAVPSDYTTTCDLPSAPNLFV